MTEAKQGQKYLYFGDAVLALETGATVKVLYINEAQPQEWYTKVVPATLLKPQPLRYFHGQIPQ